MFMSENMSALKINILSSNKRPNLNLKINIYSRQFTEVIILFLYK